MMLPLAAAPARAEQSLGLTERGLTYQSADGRLRLDLGGRIQVDSIHYAEGSATRRFLDFRQERVELSGEVDGKLEFKIEHEFSGSPGWRNLWVGYAPTPSLGLKAGNFIVPFSLEEVQGYATNPFMERSLANALSAGMALGADASLRHERWTATLGWFHDPIRFEDGRQRQRGEGVVARFTALPVSDPDGFLHLGAAFEHRTMSAGETLQISTIPEAAFAPTLLAAQGLASADSMANFGLEAAWSHGPVLVQGQAIETVVSRTAAQDEHLRGGYLQGSWVLTGQGYDYSRSTGVIRGVAVKPGREALELAARWSVLDLNTADARGGIAQNFTLGANWYLSRNFRVMLNYVRAHAWDQAAMPSRKARVLAVRLQSSF